MKGNQLEYFAHPNQNPGLWDPLDTVPDALVSCTGLDKAGHGA